MIGSADLSGPALKGRAGFEGAGHEAIRAGRDIVQQVAPELFAEGVDLAVLLDQDRVELFFGIDSIFCYIRSVGIFSSVIIGCFHGFLIFEVVKLLGHVQWPRTEKAR